MIIDKFKTVQNLFLIFLTTTSIIGCADNGEYITISSPSKTNTMHLMVDEGKLFYRVNHGKKRVVALSQLGFKFKNGQSLLDDFEVVSVDFNEVDETWEQPWGEEKLIRNNYRACTVSLRVKENIDHQLDIIVRAYDDGVAFRYHVKKLGDMEKVIIADEITEFNIAKDAQSWWIKAYGPKPIRTALYLNANIGD
jgi:alpha-glucosidase